MRCRRFEVAFSPKGLPGGGGGRQAAARHRFFWDRHGLTVSFVMMEPAWGLSPATIYPETKEKEAQLCSTRPARKPRPPATTISSGTLTVRRTARATRGEAAWKKARPSRRTSLVRRPASGGRRRRLARRRWTFSFLSAI
mgnify:CR=1 FL=1